MDKQECTGDSIVKCIMRRASGAESRHRLTKTEANRQILKGIRLEIRPCGTRKHKRIDPRTEDMQRRGSGQNGSLRANVVRNENRTREA